MILHCILQTVRPTAKDCPPGHIRCPMKSDTFLAAIHRELQRRFRAAGPGAISRVENSLQLSNGYFRDQRRPDRLRVDLRILLKTLELLEVDRAEFFGMILGSCDPMIRFRNEGLMLQLKYRRPIPILTAMQKRRDEPPAQPKEVDLAALDAQRDDNPSRLERRSKSLMRKVTDDQIVPLLGVYASACRALGKLSRAHVVLATALGAAHGMAPQILGDLLLRGASVLGDQGRYQHARELAEKAMTQFALANDRLGLAKSLIKLGMAQGCAGQQDAEIRSFNAALMYLADFEDAAALPPERIDQDTGRPIPTEVQRNLFSALTNLALAHHQQGKLDTAETFAQRAEAASVHLGPTLHGKLVWLRGTIAWQADRLPEAEGHLRRALELHHPRAPLGSALVAVDLVKVLLQQGDIDAAAQTIRTMATLVQSLERHPVALAAITQLIRCALDGKELAAAVDEAARHLSRCGELNPAEQTGWNRHVYEVATP